MSKVREEKKDMKRKGLKKKVGALVISAVLVLSFGLISNAYYVTGVSTSFQQVGTSGSQWRTKATGRSSNVNGWLQAAIKLNSDNGWRWGSADSGNKQILTAYSPGRVGAVGNMSKRADHN